MTTTLFDTLAYTKRLKAAGFDSLQAEALAEALVQTTTGELATKSHLEAKLGETRESLNARIAEAKNDVIRWTAGMLIAQAAVVATLMKLLA
jgi:hypothetical protein